MEGLRAQRAIKQLASMLAKGGLHVLRFDYFGTGDSAGGCGEGSVAQWLSDIFTAAEELSDTAGVKEISLAGLRFGGTLATMAAATAPSAPAKRRSPMNKRVLAGAIVAALAITAVAGPVTAKDVNPNANENACR